MDATKLYMLAFEYLKKNPYRFNEKEKLKFMQDLRIWVDGNSDVIADEVYDFLIDAGLVEQQRREDEFVSYLNKKYGMIHFGKILDVGAGRLCKLSQALTRYGNKMYAIDPNIRLNRDEARGMQIFVKTEKFLCDDYAKRKKGTLVDIYDHIVGLEPCDATEHIIRQGLKYDKPFDILLCATPHKALSGEEFSSYEDWYKHLESISSEVNIKKVGGSYYASNIEREF